MMRVMVLAIAGVLGATPALAQQTPAAEPQSQLPPDWSMRLDRVDSDRDDVRFTTDNGSMEIRVGPAAIYYRDGMEGAGVYAAQADFTQLAAVRHPEAYGLFIGGADLDVAHQRYTYFLVRQDGKFLVKRRHGDSTSILIPWTGHAAVNSLDTDEADGVRNRLSIYAGSDAVQFLVNGTEVARLPRNEIDAAGQVGLRVNHRLGVRIEDFAVTAQ